MSLVDDIMNQVMREKAWLHRGFFPLPVATAPTGGQTTEQVRTVSLSSKQIDLLLRVEVDLARGPDVARYLHERCGFGVQSDVEWKIAGVSFYVVRHNLPAPGWRIVNPFR